MARKLIDIHERDIWRFLRAQKIDLAGRKFWHESNDPDFVPKAAEIVGLLYVPARQRGGPVRSMRSP
jgi:hypothetical protein